MLPLFLLFACTVPPESPLSEAAASTPPPQAVSTEAAAVHAPSEPTMLEDSDPEPLRDRVASADISWPPPRTHIRVDKSERRLELFSDEVLLKTYRVGLGSPDGDKVQEGDLKTPNGEFTVVSQNSESNYHLFLGLSYPMPEDADRGVRDGLITKSQSDAIYTANAAGKVPPWNTTLGGAIGIHGNGGWTDWTLGCIAVDDDEMDELWSVITRGSKVVVQE